VDHQEYNTITVSAYSHRGATPKVRVVHMIWIAVHADFVNTFIGTNVDRFE
jgi:hypothetical protein